jgi:hypothetical protein
MVQASQVIWGDLISKTTKAKRADRVAQVAEWLPSQYKGVSSTPSTAKKKGKKNVLFAEVGVTKDDTLDDSFLS